MRTPITPVNAMVLAIACCIALLGNPALAQVRVTLPKSVAPLPHDEESPQERINRLENTINALQARLAADEKKLQEASDAAGQAKAGIGFINIGLGKQIEDLKVVVAVNMGTTNTQIASASGKLDALSSKFATHTHTYGKTTFGWWSQQMHDLKMAAPTATSGPN